MSSTMRPRLTGIKIKLGIKLKNSSNSMVTKNVELIMCRVETKIQLKITGVTDQRKNKCWMIISFATIN